MIATYHCIQDVDAHQLLGSNGRFSMCASCSSSSTYPGHFNVTSSNYVMLTVVNHGFLLGEFQTAPLSATLWQFVTHLYFTFGLPRTSWTRLRPMPLCLPSPEYQASYVQGIAGRTLKPEQQATEHPQLWKTCILNAAVSHTVLSSACQVSYKCWQCNHMCWLSSGCKSDKQCFVVPFYKCVDGVGKHKCFFG